MCEYERHVLARIGFKNLPDDPGAAWWAACEAMVFIRSFREKRLQGYSLRRALMASWLVHVWWPIIDGKYGHTLQSVVVGRVQAAWASPSPRLFPSVSLDGGCCAQPFTTKPRNSRKEHVTAASSLKPPPPLPKHRVGH